MDQREQLAKTLRTQMKHIQKNIYFQNFEYRLRLCESEELKETRRTWPTGSVKEGTHKLAETEAASMGPAWVCIRSSSYYVSLVFLWDF